ncbi:unnamed protein product, partial [marine sediment metagenome]
NIFPDGEMEAQESIIRHQGRQEIDYEKTK